MRASILNAKGQIRTIMQIVLNNNSKVGRVVRVSFIEVSTE